LAIPVAPTAWLAHANTRPTAQTWGRRLLSINIARSNKSGAFSTHKRPKKPSSGVLNGKPQASAQTVGEGAFEGAFDGDSAVNSDCSPGCVSASRCTKLYLPPTMALPTVVSSLMRAP